ncbi:5'-methylthioadenosine/adenosylhomocysteine nucleosidase [Clostridium sp.]|uniref:5'-methylthioadenosine/adenosylhomocysteine nucleosidase n=1 Tax=Clostridium sp. TaxID=1506 RepID=UPI0032165B75
MSTLGIIGVKEIEIRYIKESMKIVEEVAYSGFLFYIGNYNTLNIVLCCTDMGKVNSAECTQILITKFNVKRIISTGIVGSLNPEVKICDIVISNKVTYYDISKSQMKTLFPNEDEFVSNEYLKRLAIKAYNRIELKECGYHIGRIITGETFVSDDKTRADLRTQYHVECIEMEGGAIAHICHINKIPFILIRGICDNADQYATILYRQLDMIAACGSAKFVIKLLEELTYNERDVLK